MGLVQHFDPAAPQTPVNLDKPDLDTEAAIDRLVIRFYYKLLNDPVVGPVFYDVAKIDVGPHILKIAHYWYKMLLGDSRYKRHTMQKHRDVHCKSPLRGEHHERWLAYFMETVDEDFSGPKAAQAKRLAMRFSENLYRQTWQLDTLPRTVS